MKIAALVLALVMSACGTRTALSVDDSERCDGLDQDGDGRVDEGLPLVLSEPIVLRAAGETMTSDCDGCDRVGDPEVIPVDGGLAVLWVMPFSREMPVPNIFVRRTDQAGNPLGPATVWADARAAHRPGYSWLEGAVLPDGRAIATFCEYRADSHHRPVALLVDSGGTVTSGLVQLGRHDECAYLQVGWTEERVAFVRPASSWGYVLELAGPDARVIASNPLTDESRHSPLLATSHLGALVMLWEPPTSSVVHAFDPEGRPSGEPVALPVLGAPGAGASVTSSGDLWRVLVGGEEGITSLTLAADGTVVSPPHTVGDRGYAGVHDAIEWGSGGAVVVTHRMTPTPEWPIEVILLSAEDEVEQVWRAPEISDSPWEMVSMRSIGGSAVIVYSPHVGLSPNEVRLRTLTCGR